MDRGRKSDNPSRGASWLDLLIGQGPPGREHELPVLSGSMAPTIPAGSTLVVRAASWRESHDGEVVVFRDEQSLVAHRRLLALPYLTGALILQKGDTNATAGWIDATRIVGIAAAVRLPDGQGAGTREKHDQQQGNRNRQLVSQSKQPGKAAFRISSCRVPFTIHAV